MPWRDAKVAASSRAKTAANGSGSVRTRSLISGTATVVNASSPNPQNGRILMLPYSNHRSTRNATIDLCSLTGDLHVTRGGLGIVQPSSSSSLSLTALDELLFRATLQANRDGVASLSDTS